MLFPEIGPKYYDEKDQPILKRMENFYAESVTINQSFWSEAYINGRFEAGDQTVYNDWYGNLSINRKRQFCFNRIRRVINMIHGHQCRNRKSTIVTGYENFDQNTADQFTKILINIANREGVYETISEAFRGALIHGMSMLHVWVDYRSDPVSGNIKVDNDSFSSWLIDPFFRKQDLSDCNGLWKRSFMTKREAISLLPDKEDEIMNLHARGGNNRDGKFQFTPESYDFSYTNLLTYDEFYYRDYRKQKMMVDVRTGETLEWKGKDEDKLRSFLAATPQVSMIETTIPTVNLAIVVQGKVLFHGPNPLGIDKYPFVPIFAYYRPELPDFPNRVQGVVNGLRDAQFLYNRRRIIELDILESQVSSGFIYREDALVNPKDVFMTGQGKGIALKAGADMASVQKIIPPDIPPSMIQLSELLAKEVEQISGVSEELLGSATDEKAGILSMLRQGAGLTTLQNLFDNLDHAQKLLGNLFIDVIQANYTPGKVKVMLEGEEPAPLFYNEGFGKYHAVVEEGVLTSTQKQMAFAQLLQLREVGVQIPDEILLDACTLQNKSKLIESIQKQQQAQQQQAQQQAQLQMQQMQSQIKVADSMAFANEGSGMERMSRVKENEALAVERIAEARKDEDIGLLNLVKAMKEIDTMDIEHLGQLLNLQQQIKTHEMQMEQASKPENVPIVGS